MFLDGYDCIEPEMLEVIVKYLDQHAHVSLIYSDACLIDREDRVLNLKLSFTLPSTSQP